MWYVNGPWSKMYSFDHHLQTGFTAQLPHWLTSLHFKETHIDTVCASCSNSYTFYLSSPQSPWAFHTQSWTGAVNPWFDEPRSLDTVGDEMLVAVDSSTWWIWLNGNNSHWQFKWQSPVLYTYSLPTPTQPLSVVLEGGCATAYPTVPHRHYPPNKVNCVN